jgi:hypothetical protein
MRINSGLSRLSMSHLPDPSPILTHGLLQAVSRRVRTKDICYKKSLIFYIWSKIQLGSSHFLLAFQIGAFINKA